MTGMEWRVQELEQMERGGLCLSLNGVCAAFTCDE